MNCKIRKMLEGEVSLLQDFLYEAIFVPEGMPAPPKSIINQPELQVYITDFGKKKDDIGLAAGVLTAIATMAAVIYANSKTKKQLKEQEIRFENERKEEYKRSRFVVIKPTLMLTTFTGLLDKLIVYGESLVLGVIKNI